MIGCETIVAVSSPPGRSSRGLLRVSGPNLEPSLEDLFEPPPAFNQLSPCRWRKDALACLVMFRKAPQTYTGEDMIEIQIPGNAPLLERVQRGLLQTLKKQDSTARLAEAGEFTHRAFTHGRIDLTKAEGIAATIAAHSDAQLRAAKMLRTGRLGTWAERVVQKLTRLLALVEAGIDFVDQEDVVAIAPKDLASGLQEIECEVSGLLGRSRTWAALESAPWVVICGPANAGKSTLFNALLGRDRAVTANVPGTTRDVLSEPMRIDTDHGLSEIMLVDVAGFDPSSGFLNDAMQHAACEAIERAELIVLMHEYGTDAPSLSRRNVPVLEVQSKIDLHPEASEIPVGDTIHLSARTGQGMKELRMRMIECMQNRAVTLAGEAMALSQRHMEELSAALQAVRDAGQYESPELAAQSMRSALDHLGALGGEMTPDDILGHIFSTFCVGK